MIHRAAVHHRPKSNDAYAFDEETVHVRLRTERDDVAEVQLLFGDKYDWVTTVTRTAMRHVGSDDRFDYWQLAVEPPHRRLSYAFVLSDDAPDDTNDAHNADDDTVDADNADDDTHDAHNADDDTHDAHNADDDTNDAHNADDDTNDAHNADDDTVDADNTETLLFTERGLEETTIADLPTDAANGSQEFFEYPFINPVDVHDPPEWVSDAVFYQIFPERFAKGDPSIDPADVEPEWGGKPARDSFYGGDLQGIIDHLDYLEDLGITALYLTPVFESTSNHKYNTTDYMNVDPAFGDEETLTELVEAAHDRGIRVMLDAVFNHCGREFEPFQDVIENGADSQYADWFHVHEFPIEFEPRPTYDAFAFEPYMPKLNTENPEVKEYLIDVATYWIEEFDIDGWRLDVANEVDHVFWRDLRDAVKSVKPDAYILGEIWHDSRAWLQGDQFDAVMNYPFSYATYDFLTEESIDATGYADRTTSFEMRYPDQVNQVLFNLLGSHDTERLLHRCDGDTQTFRLALLLLFTAPGTPCVYYGDEVGMTGDDDPDCRRPMVWDPGKQDRDLRSFVQDLIELRLDTRPLRRGAMQFDRERSADDLLVFRRVPDGETDATSVTVAINRGDEAVTVPIDGVTDAPELLLRTGDVTVNGVAGGDVDARGKTNPKGDANAIVTLGPTAGAVWR